MHLSLELEVECCFEDPHNGAYCFGGALGGPYYRDLYPSAPCPRCHGRGKVPTAAGYELMDFIRHNLAHPIDEE